MTDDEKKLALIKGLARLGREMALSLMDHLTVPIWSERAFTTRNTKVCCAGLGQNRRSRMAVQLN